MAVKCSALEIRYYLLIFHDYLNLTVKDAVVDLLRFASEAVDANDIYCSIRKAATWVLSVIAIRSQKSVLIRI